LLRNLDLETKLVETPESDRYDSYMDAGNEVRARIGTGAVLALSGVYQIQQERTKEKGTSLPLSRTAYVVRSLKHPEEVGALRDIYGSGFFLLGVHASYDVRLDYLTKDKNISKGDAKRLIERDKSEGDPLGQRTRDTFGLCDAFVSIHSQDYKKQIWRILDLLFGTPFVTPTADEYARFLAYGASLRSADLSRQVGAVIVDRNGEIIATGANDVPKFGGGLYFSNDDPDERDWARGCDSNERERDKIASEILVQLGAEQSNIEDDISKLRSTGLFDITEYGRAVHAEMEALLSCSRSASSPRDGVLYSTTFPCHNCAKHLVAAGIKRVVYVEPYPKSKALELHDDSITLTGQDGKVSFEPFTGVGPRPFIDLFSLNLSSGRRVRRKVEGGKTVTWLREDAELRIQLHPNSYLDLEKLATSGLDALTRGET